MRVVIDCNVLVSAALTDGTCRAAILLAVGRDDIFVSAPILAEYRGVVMRPKYRKYQATALSVVDMLASVAHRVEPLEPMPLLPDPKDSVYLATALASQAHAIITGNTKDFPPDLCEPVRILTPRVFLDLAEGLISRKAEEGVDGELRLQALSATAHHAGNREPQFRPGRG
jgi:putative PIN family toxin of toxin-antitoxin system